MQQRGIEEEHWLQSLDSVALHRGYVA